MNHWRHRTYKTWIIISAAYGLLPVWCQAIFWTNDGFMTIGPLRTIFGEIWIKIRTFSSKKMQFWKCQQKMPFISSQHLCVNRQWVITWTNDDMFTDVYMHRQGPLLLTWINFNPSIDTLRCHYNVINFLQNPHQRHSIAHTLGRDMGWLLWFQTLLYILPQSM